jgi:hypothetical protein
VVARRGLDVREIADGVTLKPNTVRDHVNVLPPPASSLHTTRSASAPDAARLVRSK